MHGPYGIVLQFENSNRTPDEEIEKGTIQLHQFIKSLPGFRAAMYYNFNEEHYCATFSFETESHTDSALAQLKPILEAQIPGVRLTKTEVVPGELIPSA